MRLRTRDKLIPLTLLAAASGARATAGVAAISRRRAASRLLATGELVADKMPGVPDRTDPLPLAARVAGGALVGAMVGNRLGMNRGQSALLGGLIAFASAHGTRRVRRSLIDRVNPIGGAFIEDALVAAFAAAGVRQLRANQRRQRLTAGYLRG